MAASSRETGPDGPRNEFSGGHEGIVENLKQLQRLLELLRQSPPGRDIRKIAKNLIGFYRDLMLIHHEEEEHELFTADMDAASDENKASVAGDHIKRLVAEHREPERMRLRIEPDIELLSKSRSCRWRHKCCAGRTCRRSGFRCTCASRKPRRSTTSDPALPALLA